MTVANLQINPREFVIIARRDYDHMRAELDTEAAQDRADAAEAVKRVKDPRQRSIPWAQAKKRLGLA